MMRIFKEKQRFNKLWLIILILSSLVMAMAMIIAAYLKNPDSFTTLELMGIISLSVGASGLIFLFKLTTRIDEKGISYKFFPFHFSYKVINWFDVEKAYVRHYDAISEYGGWGIKGGPLWSKSKGKAINVSGDIGIQLELKNGKKLLIGTQKKAEAENVLATYSIKINT